MPTVKEYITEYFNSANLSLLPTNAIFLVGSNPLPVYVAGITLKPEKIFLLGTASVSPIMDSLESCLKEALGLSSGAVHKATCNPADSCDIQCKTRDMLNKLPAENRDIWLCYTAGT